MEKLRSNIPPVLARMARTCCMEKKTGITKTAPASGRSTLTRAAESEPRHNGIPVGPVNGRKYITKTALTTGLSGVPMGHCVPNRNGKVENYLSSRL